LACLAPMDGFTDIAYRQIVRKLNPEVILFSEFTSTSGIQYSEKVKSRLDFHQVELPYVIQLFGNNPESFQRIVQELDGKGASGFDINMGCPAKKIIRSESGAYLMSQPDLACRIVESCVKATSSPVSVKTRLGFNQADELIPFVKKLESAGVGMVTIHGRTYKQAFRGEADFQPIYELKKEVSIPVICNGDIKNSDDGLSRLENLDGYMIGRAAVGNPWCFWSEEKRKAVTLKEKIEIMILHFKRLRSLKPEPLALIEFRKHISGYISGFQNAKAFRSVLMECKSEHELTHCALSLV